MTAFAHDVSTDADLAALVATHLEDPRSTWSVGSFGAIAEFQRDRDEPVDLVRGPILFSAATGRGALRLALVPGLRAFAYETVASAAGGWHHAIAFCLPVEAAQMHGRAHLIELGGDDDAIREVDRAASLFDVGLACRPVDVCVRSGAPGVLAALRESAGRGVLDAGNPLMGRMPALSPHRVFISRAARIEVYQPVPPPDGRSPAGPHTHVLPRLLGAGRSHAATVPIPEGWLACAHLYPAHPMHDALDAAYPFDAAAHRAFQSLLARYGNPALWALKSQVMAALAEDRAPSLVAAELTRQQRATVRVALRQRSAATSGAAIAAWAAGFDP